jgi:tetratricopeptide (TPR) repeat protein
MEFLKFLQHQLAKKAVGTLTLGKRQGFREIFFQGESMYLVGDRFSGKVAFRRLQELGILGPRLSLAQLEKVVQETDRTKQIVATALLEKQLLSEEEHNEAALENLAEEMIDLLGVDTGSFHFQEGRVPEYLLTSEGIAVRTAVPIQRVLQEIRRRSELASNFAITVPSLDEVFVLSEKGLALRHSKQGDFLTQRLCELLDGLRNLRTVLADSYFYSFEVLSAAARALDEGLIKKTLHPELKGISPQELSREDAEKYLPYFKDAVKHGMDELSARERLAVVYERLGAADEAVIQYNFIGDVLYRMGKSSKAIKAYQRALQLRPGEFLVAEKITRIYSAAADQEIANGNKQQAMQFLEGALRMRPEDSEVFSKLLSLLLEGKKLQEVAAICDFLSAQARQARRAEIAAHALREVLRHLPANAAFRKKLINVYLDLGMAAEAAAELQVLAHQYLERGQAAKAQELIEKIRRLGTSPSDTQQLARKTTAALGTRRRRRHSRALLPCVALLLGYQVWSYTHWMNLRADANVALAEAYAPAEVKSFGVTPVEKACTALASKYEAFVRDFPLSFVGREAARRREDMRRTLHQIDLERTAAADRRLAEGRLHAAEGHRDQVRELLEPLLALNPHDVRRMEATELLAQMARQEISADELLAQAQKLMEAGDARGSYAVLRRLVDELPGSQLLEGLHLPITLESVPREAEVVLHGGRGEKRALGRTPVVVSLPVGGTAEVELTRHGHRPLRVEVREEDGATSVQLLPREPEWTQTLSGKATQAPTLTSRWAILRTADGRLAARDLHTGAEVWRLQSDPTLELVAPCLCLEGRFVGAWNNGKAVFGKLPASLDAPHEPAAIDVFLGGLATSAIQRFPGSRWVAVGVSPAKLHAYDLAGGALAWSLSLDDMVEKLAPIDDDLLAATAAGHVARVRSQPPGILWRRQAGHGAVAALAASGHQVLVLTHRNQIVTLDAGTGAQVSLVTLEPGWKACLSSSARAVYALELTGFLSRFRGGEATPAARRQVEIRAEGLLPLSGLLGIRHSGGRGLLLTDEETLEPRWNIQTQQAIRHAVAQDGLLLVVCEDGRVAAYRDAAAASPQER